jgi:hypothetical protein
MAASRYPWLEKPDESDMVKEGMNRCGEEYYAGG